MGDKSPKQKTRKAKQKSSAGDEKQRKVAAAASTKAALTPSGKK